MPTADWTGLYHLCSGCSACRRFLMQTCAQGLLTVKLVHKQDNLASINRSHELLQAHAEHAAANEPELAPVSHTASHFPWLHGPAM